MELTVVGCSGSYGAPPHGACSGYLVRDGDTSVLLDCGSGSLANLARHMDPTELTAVVITHEHADHCMDIYGIHVQLQYGSDRRDLPVYAPPGAAGRLGIFANFADTFVWHDLADAGRAEFGTLGARFALTDHPVPTFAVELTNESGRRLAYTADTGPRWSIGAFGPGADLVLSEASYEHANRRSPLHISGREAGAAAREAEAAALVLTHLWPQVDPEVIRAEGSDAFGAEVLLAGIDLHVSI